MDPPLQQLFDIRKFRSVVKSKINFCEQQIVFLQTGSGVSDLLTNGTSDEFWERRRYGNVLISTFKKYGSTIKASTVASGFSSEANNKSDFVGGTELRAVPPNISLLFTKWKSTKSIFSLPSNHFVPFPQTKKIAINVEKSSKRKTDGCEIPADCSLYGWHLHRREMQMSQFSRIYYIAAYINYVIMLGLI